MRVLLSVAAPTGPGGAACVTHHSTVPQAVPGREASAPFARRPLTLRIGPYQDARNPYERTRSPPTSGPPCPPDREQDPHVRRRLLALACAFTALLGGCGLMPGGEASGRRTVTVWLMRHSASQDFLDRFTEDFERAHPDLELDIRIQEWTGIGEK